MSGISGRVPMAGWLALSVVRTQRRLGHSPRSTAACRLPGRDDTESRNQPAHLLPQVHPEVPLLKRRRLALYQGSVGSGHLDCLLDEFASGFNRRNSISRGKLFCRLAEQAVPIQRAPFSKLIKSQAVGIAVSGKDPYCLAAASINL